MNLQNDCLWKNVIVRLVSTYSHVTLREPTRDRRFSDLKLLLGMEAL